MVHHQHGTSRTFLSPRLALCLPRPRPPRARAPTPSLLACCAQPTDLGRIASHFYVSYTTIAHFNEHLKPTMTDIELLRLFSIAEEFKWVPPPPAGVHAWGEGQQMQGK